MATAPGSAGNSPAVFAEEMASVIADVAESLALLFVTFAGSRSATEGASPIAFETYADLQAAGFTPLIQDSRALVSPRSVPEVSQQDLFAPACRTLVAFLTLYANNSAGINLTPADAQEFSRNAPSFVAKRCAGRFGFPPDARETFGVLGNMLDAFVHTNILNQQACGVDDCLSDILKHISPSSDGKTRHGFVTGSERQYHGCGNRFVAATGEISQRIKVFGSSRSQ